jgi:hypothetical protein
MDMLFHDDDDVVLGTASLREIAARGVRACPLMQKAWRGDRDAIAAMHIGYWPFVHEFERAIDLKMLPRAPLRERFGSDIFNAKFLALAREVREMKREEGSHAAHWVKDAHHFGIETLEGPAVPAVEALVARSHVESLPEFFSFLAATELVAEEVSAFLLTSAAFVEQSTRKRWVWGIVHTAPHGDGPSHLEIDLDLARAYQTQVKPEAIRALVLSTYRLFRQAADQIEQTMANAGQVCAAE